MGANKSVEVVSAIEAVDKFCIGRRRVNRIGADNAPESSKEVEIRGGEDLVAGGEVEGVEGQCKRIWRISAMSRWMLRFMGILE